jgi:NADH dehydrogenase
MPKPLLTPDQVILLQSDNIVTGEEDGDLASLDVEATPIETLLPRYLRRFRPDIRTS